MASAAKLPTPPPAPGGQRPSGGGRSRRGRGGRGQHGGEASPHSADAARGNGPCALGAGAKPVGGGFSGSTVGMVAISGGHGEEVQLSFEESLIRYFKTRRCTAWDSGLHDHRSCAYYHSTRDSDRRRPVLLDGCFEPLYSADPCAEKFDSQRPCSAGDVCGFCHSTAELLYHPDIFRKRLCHQGQNCPRGRFCAFAHSRHELLVPHFEEAEEQNPSEDFIAFHFKTQWCPIGGPHDWEACVYAHTYRDWRRSPAVGYSSRPCPHWSRSVAEGPAELGYAERCPRGMACALAHGSKEQLYHPQFYKTNPCSDKRCRRGPLCAFHHGARDARRGAPGAAPPPAARGGRDRLPGAEELLAAHQPTYMRPPKYHALEDPGRWGGHGGSVSSGQRGRGGRGGRQRQTARAAPAWEEPEQHHPAANGGYGGLEAGLMPEAFTPDGFVSEAFVPYYCQWLPCTDPSGQALPPFMGCCGGEAAEGWDEYGQMLWDQPATAFVPAAAALGHGQWLMQAPAGMPQEVAELLEAGAERPVVDVESLPSVLALDGALRSAEGLEQQGMMIRGQKREVRTPSWSPPQSATPTEVPSPRPAELTAGSSGCSGDASPDDLLLAPPRA